MWDRLAGPQVNRLPESPAPSINGRYLSVAIRIWATKWPYEATIFWTNQSNLCVDRKPVVQQSRTQSGGGGRETNPRIDSRRGSYLVYIVKIQVRTFLTSA